LPDERARRELIKRAPERETLEAFLDYQRAAVVGKLEGLDKEQATRRLVPSLTTLLGVAKHLAYVEAWWFQDVFSGRDVTYPWTDEDPDAEFRVGGDDTVDSVIALYESMIEQSRSVVAAADLDDLATRDVRGSVSLRWILFHMIEETARHAGHMDILRELADGPTGE
jgi:uncharacterized damage-inducible protein DinB